MEWESEEAVDYADELYEQIAYLTIQASMELSKEKTSYPLFKGSKWDTGAYFEQKGYESAEWLTLKNEVKEHGDRKSTRLNSSHVAISYAVFCLKKKSEKPYDQEIAE